MVEPTPKALRERLLAAMWQQSARISHRFSQRRIDARHRRLVSDDGCLALAWFSRKIPTQPVDDYNPQTPLGEIHLVTYA